MLARTAGTRTSPWLYMAMAAVGCLLGTQALLAVAVGPLVDAVAEVQPARAKSAVEVSQPGGLVNARSDETGGVETAMCRTIVDPGVPPAPRWIAGWAR